MTGKIEKITANNLTNEQISDERVSAWRTYHTACAASGYVPLPGGVVPISQSCIDEAKREVATTINARREKERGK